MFSVQSFVRRRRKVLIRLGSLAAALAAGVAFSLPVPTASAGVAELSSEAARDSVRAGDMRLLLLPEPISTTAFGTFRAPSYS